MTETPIDGCGDTGAVVDKFERTDLGPAWTAPDDQPKKLPAVDHGGMRQIVVHPAVWDRLEEWFAIQGLTLVQLYEASEADLETFIISYPAEVQNDSPEPPSKGLGVGRLSDL